MTNVTTFFRRQPFWLWIALLLPIIGAGVVAGLLVFTRGLAVTNLSDLAPWGLWIVTDLSFIALAAGAFSISALTHLAGLKALQPLARMAVFIGVLGYTGAMLSLVLDIGRPERFWHALVYWNVHSMLWEVTISITLYFTVLILEVFPIIIELAIFDRLTALRNLGRRIHRLAPILAIIGLGISLLHQSSLGATYGVVAGRASLFKASMPLLFIVSAVAGGMAFCVQMTLIVQWLKQRIFVPRAVLFQVGQVAGLILLVYLYMRFWDSTAGNYGYVPGRSEADTLLTQGRNFAIPFWGLEMILGGVVAAAFLILARVRQSATLLMLGCGLAMAGIVANRWNTTMLAFTLPLSTEPYLTTPGVAAYTPSLVEWAASLGIVAGVTLVFSLGAKFLPAFHGEEVPETALVPAPERSPLPAPATGD